MRSYPGFCRRKQLEYNPGLTHRRRAGHPRANRRTSDRPSFGFPGSHRLAGGDVAEVIGVAVISRFYPRTPAGCDREVHKPQRIASLISIHAPLAGCDFLRCRSSAARPISIHAPLAGCDSDHAVIRGQIRISIHAPLAGCDQHLAIEMVAGMDFNPRTPCGVRLGRKHPGSGKSYFNPRTPCGVRPDGESGYITTWAISIHAPLAGCDQRCPPCFPGYCHFNPRTPCGVRPSKPLPSSVGALISIHAPLAGCDPHRQKR